MKEKILKICNLISAVFFVVLLCLFSVVSSTVVYAATSEEVLQDLRKDKNFNADDYPYVADDYGLHVIQIAESSNKELFVYAYQPCHDTYDLVGTKISISYGYSLNGAGLKPKLYNLKLLSTSGTLDKYHVEGFTIPNDGDRYYNIVEIFRMVNTDIDGEQDEAFPKTDIAYSVGQQWYVCDLNNSKHYEMNTFNTLYVETVWNDYFTFSDGLTWLDLIKTENPIDCWFYCFSVEDYVVERIFDADLNYSIRHVRDTYGYGDHTLTYSDVRENLVKTLKTTGNDTEMSYVPSGLGAPSFKWKRILSSKEFIEIAEKQGVKIDSIVRENVLKSQWVFTYLETERTEDKYGSAMTGGVHHIDNYEDVYDVGLLRLRFQDTSGKKYDLGVVNDLTDPDNIAGGKSETDLRKAFEEFWEMFMKIILTIVGVILFVVVLNVITPIKDIFKFIFKGIKMVVSAPFKLLKSIFKKDG